jgi:hypothetical protein
MRGDDEAGIIILTEADGIVGSGDTDDDFFVNEKENTDNDQNEDFEIVLTSRPLEGVKVVITSSDPSLNVAQCQIKLAGGTFADSVEFNRENNWDTAQKLEVRAIDDNIDESKDNTSLPADPGSNDSHSCALQVTITSDDPKYNWDPPPSTNPDTEYLSNVQTELNKVIINDNDQPPEITVISINSTLVPPTPTPPPTSFEINQGATDIDIKAELSMEGRSAKKITITVKLLGDNDATCDDATLEGDTADASTGDEFIWDILADGSKEATAFQILANGGNDALKECFRIQFVLPANPPANGDGPPQIMNPGPYLIAINLPNPVTLLLTPSEQTALNTPLPNQPLRPELN